MWIANLIGGATTLFFGLIIRIFKTVNIIAGYNTVSKEEKSKYNEEKLAKCVGNMLIISSVILLIGGLIYIFFLKSILVINISWLLYLLVIVSGVVYMNIGNTIKK